MKSFLPYPAVVLFLSFGFVLAFAHAGLAFAFVVRARPYTCLVVLKVFGFLSKVFRHVSIDSHHEQLPWNF